jgi:hypothetical protein
VDGVRDEGGWMVSERAKGMGEESG